MHNRRYGRRALALSKPVAVPPKHKGGPEGPLPDDALNRLYHGENFQLENTEAAHQFDPTTRTPIEDVLEHTEGQEYLRMQDAVAQNVLAHVTATMPHRRDFEMMLAELQHMRVLLKTQLDDAYKRRVWQDEWVALGTLVEYTLDYHERTYLFLYSTVALTLGANDGTSIAISQGWNNISFRRGLKVTVTNPVTADSQPIWVLVRACDEIQALFMTIPGGVALNAGGFNIGNVGIQSDYPIKSPGGVPIGAVPVTGVSGNQANAIATATLPSAIGKTTFITGFEVTGSGATGALVVTVTVTNTVQNTLSYTYVFVAGVTSANQPLIIEFPKPIPASAVNQTIIVSCPASGAGGTNNTVVAHGYQF